MRMRLALLALTALALAACGGVSRPGGTPVVGPSPSPTGAGGPVRFVLQDTYRQGQRIEVRITNAGDRAYRYNASGYEACDLTYRFEDGEEFIIPPGTHCDLIVIEEMAPGETVTLFEWSLDQCLKDQWGCVKSEELPPGRYTIEGKFKAVGGGPPARASASFEIVPAHNIPDVAPDETDGRPEPSD
ncbi:MAG TPA: hypothetical protein VHL78_10135 [Actinomycetota bacterium]|nr:hypothetical protein [Actinomycetota bacterium]